MVNLTGPQARWDHPDDPAAVGQSGIGQLTHEADAAAPVHEPKAPAGDESSEGTGSIPVAGISRIRRPAEHADRAEGDHGRNLSDHRLPGRPAAVWLDERVVDDRARGNALERAAGPCESLGGAAVGDIISQRGDREPGPWPRRVAMLAVLVLAAVLIVEHLPHHVPDRTSPRRAAVTVVPLPGQAAGPDGVSGLAMPRDGSLRLPATGQQPAWLWPATGRIQPIGGLPRNGPGYQFIRVAGGWAVQANSAARLRCGSCAKPRLPVYFLADHAQSATPAGTADEIAPSAAADALWLTSYPPGADVSRAAGTAQEISLASASAGPRLRLPAGYVIYQGTDRGLLLAPAAPSGTATYMLWSPAAPQAVSRTFAGVLAASANQIAWATRCAPVCRVEVLDLATGPGRPP